VLEVGTATFRPRGLCGRRYPWQRPHCNAVSKRRVTERGNALLRWLFMLYYYYLFSLGSI